jgi:ketosteroid isomerase-like protein
MSEENVAIVRQIYEAFPRAFGLVRAERFEEWEAMPEWELYDPEVVLEEVAELPDTDTYEGIEGIRRWTRAGAETFDDVRWEPRAISSHGPHVLVDVHGRFRGAGSGVKTELDVTHLWTLRDGRIVRLTGFLDRGKALEAAGLSE